MELPQLLDNNMNSGVESKDSSAVVTVENEITTGEEDLARGRERGGGGGRDGV